MSLQLKTSKHDHGKKSNSPWQCCLSGPLQRLKYLLSTGRFADILIECAGGVQYNLHGLVLAMSSPVFETMIFDSLGTSNKILCLDDDPGILKNVFLHCYGCDFQCDDINIALKIYKIADKYMISDLITKYTGIIQNLIKPENFKIIIDFTISYGYNNLRNSCIKFLQQQNNYIRATSVLMWFSVNSPKDLMMPTFAVSKLIFDSWRNPKSAEPSHNLVTLLQSNCCHGLKEFAGNVSGEIIEFIPGPLRSTATDPCDHNYTPALKLSIQKDNAEEVIMALHERNKKYGAEDIGIHITTEDISSVPDELSKLPCYGCDSDEEFPPGRFTIYFSDATKEDIDNLYFLLYSIKPVDCESLQPDDEDLPHRFVNGYMFPRCKLKNEEDFTYFGADLFMGDYSLLPSRSIWMYSPYIEKRDEEGIDEFARKSTRMYSDDIFPCLKLMSNDNDIPGW
ncbi:unnamed protein product [Meganyctiphanes norvegica]|uniref:BTB domain-containing protein n=1 Tax=Meganyctiphanes norvegica TaxID=48144 RepID=A0AAV2SWN1_MEGNR